MSTGFRSLFIVIITLFNVTGFRHEAFAQSADTAIVTLPDLLAMAKANNPAIRAAFARVDAAKSRIPQAGTLPNPMAMYELNHIGLSGFSVGREDMSATGFSYAQPLPFPGKRRLRADMATSEAGVYEHQATAIEWDVLTQLKTAYFDLYLIDRSLEALDHHNMILQAMAGIAAAKYAVGEGIQPDILKAQTELSRVLEQRIRLQQERRATEASLNRLSGRPPGEPVGRPALVTPDSIATSQEELMALADRASPGLNAWSRTIERLETGVLLARRERYPDFTVGGGWMTRGSLPDMYQLRFGVELPLFRSRLRSMVDESRAMVAEARSERESTRQALAADIHVQWEAGRAARELSELFRLVILPQARMSLESDLAGYRAGTVEFMRLVNDLMGLRNDETQYHRNVVDHWKSLARLEQLTGASLIEKP